jgi:hypothetical protein
MDGGEANLPIFLHGMWRSGTTYVWSQFRRAPGAVCFYEPLHDALSRLSHGRLARNGGYNVEALGHDPLSAPYFAEFAPLIGIRGVRGYRTRFALERLVMRPDDRHPALERYVRGLVDHASASGRTAVLGFNRTCLMVDWMARRFRALNVYVARGPEGICSSYLQQMDRGNPWFVAHWLWVLEHNTREPLLGPLTARLPLRRGLARLGPRESFYLEAARGMGPDQVYFMTVYLWLANMLWGAPRCDLVLDMDRLHLDPYRREAAQRLRGRSGLAVSLEGARSLRREPPIDAAARRRIEEEVLAVFPRQGPERTASPSQFRALATQLSSREAELLAEAV